MQPAKGQESEKGFERKGTERREENLESVVSSSLSREIVSRKRKWVIVLTIAQRSGKTITEK